MPAFQTENLPGMVFKVDDKTYWGISEIAGEWHPGACYGLNNDKSEAFMAKGTSQKKDPKYRDVYVEVFPSLGNGLTKTTYFSVSEEHNFPIAIMPILNRISYLGKLDESDLIAIQEAVSYAFRYDGRDAK